MKNFEICISNKEGIFDPAGETAKAALLKLGHKGLGKVKIGTYIQLEVEDSVSLEQVEEMCEKLLVNPILENYEIKA